MQSKDLKDWGNSSIVFDEISSQVLSRELSNESEAQTRFDVIDRVIREVLGWRHGQISVEENQEEKRRGYVDYILRSNDITILIEAKKIGASFPNPTNVRKLKLNSTVLKSKDISSAIEQAKEYAKSKIAQITVVTNGLCWCYFKTDDALLDTNTLAGILFPLNDSKDAEELFRLFSNQNISENGLRCFSDGDFNVPENKLLQVVRDSEMRVGRNNVADYIAPALDSALHQESIVNNKDFLRSCFVYTTARTKFDQTLSMHLVDTKPVSITPATRIRTRDKNTSFGTLVNYGQPDSAPPVTLLIAGVGVGKSTYLRHFQLVSGKELLEKKKVHWIYIDFESMGRGGNVRNFLYTKLKEYLIDPSKPLKTDFRTVVSPAYESEIRGIKEGPYALVCQDKSRFNEIVTEHIKKDFDATEPYVEKIFRHIAKNGLCVLVLDNTDLYEDEELEKDVLSEGLALAKKLFCHVIVSIRDTTFVKHKNDSIFDAYELKKLWLDPPPFREVLSKRFTLSALILKGKSATITFSKGMNLKVDDLSAFFEIARASLLSGPGAEFLESFAGLNIRRGISLAVNFLNSGHIHADKALQMYMLDKATDGAKRNYQFPFQEVFKGAVLGQWMYFKENKCDCINLFDSKLHAKNLRLLRLCILANLYTSAKSEETAQVKVKKCIDIFSKLGANEEQILAVLNDLLKYRLIKQTDAAELSEGSIVFITKTGGYHFLFLSQKMVYVESCMYDTVIDDPVVWDELASLTTSIESESDTLRRMELRKQRFNKFINYINGIEDANIKILGSDSHRPHINLVSDSITAEFDRAIYSIKRRRDE